MSKFSGSNTVTKPSTPKFGKGPLKTKTKVVKSPTFEGGQGFAKGEKTALYTLAVTNMVGEPTFYESGPNRDNRFRDLIRKVTEKDPVWISNFIPFLRDTANMRSASIVVAVEAAVMIGEMQRSGAAIPADFSVRGMISSACSRADEPAEVLGYYLANYGRKIPMGIKRGVADAANRLYNERSVLKYDGGDRGVRMGDVVELTHPKPEAGWQSSLYKHVLDRRHGHVESIPEDLRTIVANEALKNVPASERRALLTARGNEALAEAGYTWEILSGWLPGGMDAQAWGAIIPSMGYMGLLRNLRNFEQAGVGREVLKFVRDKLEDPAEVARCRQFPYRFWSAYKNSGSIFFAPAIEEALRLSCANIPELPGRTLVLIDTSGSMDAPVSGRSDIRRWEAAGLFGAAMQARMKDVTLVAYGTNWESVKTEVSILRTVENLRARLGKVGHGTNTWPSALGAIQEFGPFDRIFAFTDMQDAPPRGSFGYQAYRPSPGETGKAGIAGVLPDIPIYSWDLAGHANANVNTSIAGQYLLGGFSDASFKLPPLLEAGQNSAWPWNT